MPNMKVRPMTISAMRRKSRRFASDIFPSPNGGQLDRERPCGRHSRHFIRSGACSKTSAVTPRCRRPRASVKPPMPPPMMAIRNLCLLTLTVGHWFLLILGHLTTRNPAFDWQVGAPGSDAPRLCTVASARLAHLRFRWLRDAHVGAGHTSHLGDRVVRQIDRCMCLADGFRVWAGHEAECLSFL